jgi:hypothetical protein
MLTLYNAPNWLERVHIFNRDCALHYLDPTTTSAIQPTQSLSARLASILGPSDDLVNAKISELLNSLNYGGVGSAILQGLSGASQQQQLDSTQVESIVPGEWLGSSLVHGGEDGTNTYCVQSPFARSSVPRAFLQNNNGDYGETSFRSTLAPGQPFVYAGDTILTQECIALQNDQIAQDCTVSVHRIYGSDSGQMTLVRTPSVSLTPRC